MFDFKRKLGWTLYVIPILALLGLISFVNIQTLPTNSLNILVWIRTTFFLGVAICFFIIGYILFEHALQQEGKTERIIFLIPAILGYVIGLALFYFIYYLHTDKVDVLINLFFLSIPVLVLLYLYARKNVSKIEQIIFNFVLTIIEMIYKIIFTLFRKYLDNTIKIIELLIVGGVSYYLFFIKFSYIKKFVPTDKYGSMFFYSIIIGMLISVFIIVFIIVAEILITLLLSLWDLLKKKRIGKLK